MEVSLDLGLHQHVDRPTRFRHGQNPSRDDLVFSSNRESVTEIVYDMALGCSDHLVLAVSLTVPWAPDDHPKKQRQSRFIYNKGNYPEFKRDLKDMNLAEKVRNLPPNEGWLLIKNTISELSERHIPKLRVNGSSRRNFKPLWANPQALTRVKRKRAAWKRYLETKEGNEYEAYVEERNAARKEVRKAVRNFEKNIAKKAKTDPKSFWKYAKSRMKSSPKISQLKQNGRLFLRDEEKVEILNEFFTSVFTKEEETIPDLDIEDTVPTMPDPEFTVEDVLKKLKSINENKASGPDGIPGKLLKTLAEELAEPLCVLFSSSLNTGEVPDDWKSAHVTAIHKKGATDLAANYRPISLTSLVCKVQESIIRDCINEHLTRNGLQTEVQYGFTKGKSCKSNLIDCMEAWTKALDKGDAIDVIYLDFRKAFDSVPHKRLLRKLDAYGISGKTLGWIEGFLTGRKQRVRLNGVLSSTSDVISGVPQGSVLGPCLFAVFVNDMPKCTDSPLSLFADDAKLYRVIKAIQDCIALQADLTSLVNWAKTWQLEFNIEKCCVLRIGNSQVNFQYKMTDKTGTTHILNEVSSMRDLGVIITNDLSTKTHVEQVAASANRALYSIKRTVKDLNICTGPMLYKSLVRPILEYCHSAWHPQTVREIEILEKVQRRATRWIVKERGVSYSNRLRQLNLPTLTHRRRRGDMIEIYKYFQHPELYNNFKLQRSVGITRGHNLKVVKDRWRTVLRGKFLAHRAINDWNALPPQVVQAKTLDAFKNALDKHWSNAESLYNYRV